MRVHAVRNSTTMNLGYSSKLNAEWSFLEMLRDAGRSSADEFMRKHRHDLGRKSSIDLDVLLEQV
jgi:NTE family protein